MELHSTIAFSVIAALLVMSPGPNGFLIAKTVSSSGRQSGFANVWGFVAAFYVHGTLSIFGISVFLVHCVEAFFILKLLGAAYLIWLGTKALLSVSGIKEMNPTHCSQREPESVRGAFIEGLLTNVLNPKVSLFYLAAFPQFLTVNGGLFSAYALVSVHALINFIWFSAMVLLISRVNTMVYHIGFRKWLKVITGTVFIGFGTKLAFLRTI
ncbi:LysE family translocator [Vibrio salinus]|uniref:LysE family translocator n=1 Tax=Vibrio salinus TaxID=2899784 RepID=UPI001E593DFE|nr:LysE family translocator [Vibrio salinus]MCE0492743.1 LysE family translocator [Vibrio salinus]